VATTRGTEGPEMNATTYGLDIAKRVFQLYWVEAETGEIVNRRLRGRNSHARQEPQSDRMATNKNTPPPPARPREKEADQTNRPNEPRNTSRRCRYDS
ncbi:MAG: hypothetical protein ACREYA_26865, partial [Cupriavidus necator]